MPDALWNATIARVRDEFEEMPCLRDSHVGRVLSDPPNSR